eukprot:220829-Pleurochrysis_carterae.AAC.1
MNAQEKVPEQCKARAGANSFLVSDVGLRRTDGGETRLSGHGKILGEIRKRASKEPTEPFLFLWPASCPHHSRTSHMAYGQLADLSEPLTAQPLSEHCRASANAL